MVHASMAALLPRHGEHDDGAERFPAEATATRPPGIGGGGKRRPRRSSRRSSAARSDANEGAAISTHAAADPRHGAGLPYQPDQGPQALRLDGRLGEHLGFSQHAVDQGHRYAGDACKLQNRDRASNASIQYCMVMRQLSGACQYSGVWWEVAWNGT